MSMPSGVRVNVGWLRRLYPARMAREWAPQAAGFTYLAVCVLFATVHLR
jgi:hypothetical protein